MASASISTSHSGNDRPLTMIHEEGGGAFDMWILLAGGAPRGAALAPCACAILEARHQAVAGAGRAPRAAYTATSNTTAPAPTAVQKPAPTP